MSVLTREEIQVIREGKRVFTWGGVLDLMDTIAARDAEDEHFCENCGTPIYREAFCYSCKMHGYDEPMPHPKRRKGLTK